MSTEQARPITSQHSIWLVIFTSSETLVGTTANFFVIIYFLVSRHGKQRTAEDKMILNLAISDLFALTTCLPWRTHLLMTRQISEHTRIYSSLFVMCIFSTGNAIICIAFDRFTAVVWPLKYKTLMTANVSSTFISVSWISALALGIMHGFSYKSNKHEEYELGLALISFILLALLSCIYGVIFKIARQQRKNISNLSRISQVKFTFVRKSVWTTFLIMCLFYATFLPICILRLYPANDRLTASEKFVIWSWLNAISFINSCCNPFIYFFGIERHRGKLARSFRTWISNCRKKEIPANHDTQLNKNTSNGVEENVLL